MKNEFNLTINRETHSLFKKWNIPLTTDCFFSEIDYIGYLNFIHNDIPKRIFTTFDFIEDKIGLIKKNRITLISLVKFFAPSAYLGFGILFGYLCL